ncbi:MAG: putative ABC-type branched-chain amino acid transport system, permease component [Candidatus Eremiobacteraeota bacterium]|jgi:branched-chain amino acid transport system permease protein|nr:putative ABC-type branched-chain amino acid transport system, permease component [Candidatus Eremiobacteraeota bacterium]
MKLTPSLRNAALTFAVAIALPFVGHNGGFTNFLADAGAFVLLALGLNIVVGFAGLLDLGYAAFFAIGSYSFAMLASPQFGIHLPFWVVLFLASGIAAVFGILLGAPTLRLRGDYLAIVTLGFGEIVPQTFLNLTQWTGGPNGIGSLDQPTIGGYRFGFDPLPYYFMVLALIALAVWVAGNARNSRLGRAWMAIREDELAAAHMGINTTVAKLSAFALGASFSGLAGCALASKLQLVSPDQFGFNVSVFILAMLVLGGMGNIPGVIVGSLILSSLERFILPQATNFLHGFGLNVDLSSSRFMIYGVILVLMMLFRPEGLIPSRQRKAELHAAETEGGAAAEQELYSGAAH